MTRIVINGARRRLLPGKASDFISLFDLPPGARVVLCCRVSGYEQNRTQKLERQERWLRDQMAMRGVTVIEAIKKEESGYFPYWLAKAACIALAHGAALVADTTDRFIRTPAYSKVCQDLQARTEDLESLKFWTFGLPLMTILHPDASPSECRGHQVWRGQWATGNRGGRPRVAVAGEMKKRRKALTRTVLNLHQQGLSGRKIAADTGVPEATVRRWIKEA